MMRNLIKVYKPRDIKQVELHRGIAVHRPVPRHWHEEYQFCLIEAGDCDLTYRGSNLITPPFSLFILHPGEVHSNCSFNTAGCTYRTMFLEPELIQETAAEIHRKKEFPFFPQSVIVDKTLIFRFIELHKSFEESSGLTSQILLHDFLTELITQFAETRRAPRIFGAERKAVKKACDYLSENYAKNISLEELAVVANLSPFHFNRVFSMQIGMPPHAFQNQLKISKAKRLLRQGWKIAQTAIETGFFDQSHLNLHFKRLTGISPGQYSNNILS